MEFKSIINLMKNRYKNILKFYYPAHDKIGFTERNLSVNFAEAYTKVYENAFAWYEAPAKKITEKKVDNHFSNTKCFFDCIIFDRQNRTIVYCESKRLNSKYKIAKICDDIKKIKDISYRDYATEYYCDVNESEKYGLIIADFWEENPIWRAGIKEAFLSNNIHFKSKYVDFTDFPSDSQLFIEDFRDLKDDLIPKIESNISKYYCLLFILFKC